MGIKTKTSWKPGQSGNPKGSMPKEESLTGILREYLNSKNTKSRKTRKQELVEKAIELAMKGDSSLFRYLWDRIDGKVPDEHKIDAGVEIEFVNRTKTKSKLPTANPSERIHK